MQLGNYGKIIDAYLDLRSLSAALASIELSTPLSLPSGQFVHRMFRGLCALLLWTTFNSCSVEPTACTVRRSIVEAAFRGSSMLNSIIKTVVKLAVLVALVKFVVLPMLPGSFNFSGFNFPSPQDFLKDPIKFGKDVFAQFDPTKIVPKTPKAPDPAQVGRDLDEARLKAQKSLGF
jgi:hypothetical protein